MTDPLLSPPPPVLVLTLIMSPVVMLTIIVAPALLAHPPGHPAGPQETLTQAEHVDAGGDKDRGDQAAADNRPN